MAAGGGFGKFWVLGVLVVLLIYGVISYFLFSLQNEKLEDVRTKSDYIVNFLDEKMAVVQDGADRFDEVVKLVNRAAEMFTEMVVVKTGQAADEMMVSVAASSNPLNVKIIEIVPMPAPDNTVLASDNWRIKASGRYPEIIRFIGNMESLGVVIDAGNFALKTAQEGNVELTAVIKICTLDKLERAAEEMAAEKEREAQASTRSTASKN